MTLDWDQALSTLLREVETWPAAARLQRIGVIRDLRGQLRIAVQPSSEGTDLGALEARLRAKLGGWFAPPILATDGDGVDIRRLAGALLDRLGERWPEGWPTGWDDGLSWQPLTPGRWCGERRVRSKDAWLYRGEVSPPWPISPRAPALISFYSFKGGVGRTTTLGIIARLLADAGRRVAIVDLDLEAPGIGRFLEVDSEFGVLDLLIEHHATGGVSKETLLSCRRIVEQGKGRIVVYPVGVMNDSYIERLASLDFTPPSEGENPVEAGLRAILKAIRAQDRDLDYIFLDARAGLHDLGGLSLHALAHVDVLVGRSGRATLDGFSLVLRALSRRRAKEDLRVVIAQTFLPLPLAGELSSLAHRRWAADMYEQFERTIYDRIYEEGESLPEVMASDAMHRPWPIPDYENVARADRIIDIDSTVLKAEPYVELANRIAEMCGRPPLKTPSDEELEDDDAEA